MKFRHHKYTWSKPFTSISHRWELVGPNGAVHFNASVTEGHPVSAGLEFHHFEAPVHRADDAPDHRNCPMTGGRCWHDGTSLYASETLWPEIEGYLRFGDHQMVFTILEHEFKKHFAKSGA